MLGASAHLPKAVIDLAGIKPLFRPSARLDHAPRTAQEMVAFSRVTLDALPANVFVADTELTLIYMNPAAHRTFTEIGDSVRRVFGVEVDDIVGASIHRFHRNPQRVETILDDQRQNVSPHKAEFPFGDVTLRTHISPVLGEDGAPIAYLVVWENISGFRMAAEGITAMAEPLGTAADGIDQLRSAIQLIAESAARVNADALAGSVSAGESKVMTETLVADAAQIRDSAQAISNVAEQTKMLALNAQIEAARAGAAGNGFSVVANEVKELSALTAQAAADINQQVATIDTNVASVAASLDRLVEILDQISEGQSGVAGAAEEQSVVTAEISRTVAAAASHNRSLVEALNAR